MRDQVNYYDRFGKKHAASILACPEPEYWTTDYDSKGRIYREIKERVEQQQSLVREYFSNTRPVLDIGCGFGRQAVWLAREGFAVTGLDTSAAFIEIARQLFHQTGLAGNFIPANILKQEKINGGYLQVLLLDVLEHVAPGDRKKFLRNIHELMLPGGILILSLPHVKKRLSSFVNNRIRKNITRHIPWFLKKEEHPYPIPGKKDILNLSGRLFKIGKRIETGETDYYVLRRN